MATMTLIDYATGERDTAKAVRRNAQMELTVAQGALAAAIEQLAATTRLFADQEKALAARRDLLARATNPADAATLLDEITAGAIALRRLQAGILDARQQVDALQVDSVAADARLADASDVLTAAQASLDALDAEHVRRIGWKAAAKNPPLKTIATTAAGAKASKRFTDARDELTDLPTKLRALAKARYASQAARLDAAAAATEAAEDLRADEQETNGGLAGLVAKRELEFARAARDLRELATQAWPRLQRALALLDGITAEDLLTASEKTAVNSPDDPPLTPRNDAQALAKTLDDKQEDLDAAQARLDAALVTAQADDPGADDLSAVAAVVTEQGKVDLADTAVAAALVALEAKRVSLDQWQAIVPDAAWRKLLAFYEATAVLDELAAADPAAVVTSATDAESALATALADAATSARRVAVLGHAVALRAARAAKVEAERDNLLLSAVRGDH